MDKKANGNKNNESSCEIIKIIVTARKKAISTTKSRRPPGMRSITGPMNFAKTKNGAKLTPRKSNTRLRASPGVIDKNKESASATAIAASPAAISAWPLTSLVKGATVNRS